MYTNKKICVHTTFHVINLLFFCPIVIKKRVRARERENREKSFIKKIIIIHVKMFDVNSNVQSGNSFEGEYRDLMFVSNPMMNISLEVM